MLDYTDADAVLPDARCRITQIPDAVLPDARCRITQMQENGCTRFFLIKHWMDPAVLAWEG